MTIKEHLFNKRIISIDAFRGITIFVMVFVNELSGITNVPEWMKHMAATEDGMTFVDLVFPAFLFIVGMSIPFAFNARLNKGDSPKVIWSHTFKRALALIIMGMYMVNISYGYNESQMLISAAWWGFLAYTLPIPVWNKYSRNLPPLWKNILQYGGMLAFAALYFLYIQDNGDRGMTPKWWGILGLIGWAYLITVILYWFSNGNMKALIVIFGLSIAANCIVLSDGIALNSIATFSFLAGHAVHVQLVVAGAIISLFFFEGSHNGLVHWKVIVFTMLMFLIGYLLRPYFGISKIGGTPSWALYSAGICTILYYFLYWVMESRKQTRWSDLFMPAAANPLLIYILPGIILYFNRAIGLSLVPSYFGDGVPGILWSLAFSTLMLLAMKGFNKIHIKLHL